MNSLCILNFLLCMLLLIYFFLVMEKLLAVKECVKELKVMLGNVLNLLNNSNFEGIKAYKFHIKTSIPNRHSLSDDINYKFGLKHSHEEMIRCHTLPNIVRVNENMKHENKHIEPTIKQQDEGEEVFGFDKSKGISKYVDKNMDVEETKLNTKEEFGEENGSRIDVELIEQNLYGRKLAVMVLEIDHYSESQSDINALDDEDSCMILFCPPKIKK